VINSTTSTSATVTWTDLGGSTNWQVAISSFSGGPTTWIDVNTNTYTATNLSPNTYYRFKVRPICGFSLIAPSDDYVFATDANFCNGVQITDTGGLSNDYTDSETYIRTIIPNLPNKKIQLTFTNFDLETDYDYLYVYDGNSTSATSFNPDGYTGTAIPGPFESTAADGSLTMKFYSDGGVVASGYAADIICKNNLGTTSFEPNIDFTYYPNPTNGQVSILSKTQINEISVYNVEGRLLYQKKVNSLNAKVDVAAFANGTYFFKLKFNDKEANFKILKMN
jgi:hypothetical protein